MNLIQHCMDFILLFTFDSCCLLACTKCNIEPSIVFVSTATLLCFIKNWKNGSRNGRCANKKKYIKLDKAQQKLIISFSTCIAAPHLTIYYYNYNPCFNYIVRVQKIQIVKITYKLAQLEGCK